MAWLYVPGLEASNSELNESSLHTEPWFSWRGKPSRPLTWSKRWKKADWLKRLSGLMCDPLTVETCAERWILSLPDSHANHSQRLEALEVQQMTATFGPKFQGSLAKWNPQSSSWKTSQMSLKLRELQSLEKLPKWGMISRGELFALQMPAHLIDVRDSLPSRSVPTPTCMDTRSGRPRKMVQESLSKGNWRGVALRDYAKMFPTPTATANQTCPSMLAKGGSFDNLSIGKLNPEWVEWLMGWPIGWTDCGPAETELCHNKQN